MKIAIACDHGALQLKEALIPFIRSLGYTVRDFGTHSPESCDYPDYAAAAARAVADGDCDKGIVLCTTGIGVSITANKINGIRCALLSDVNSAKMTRLHNDTNMMALGAAVVNQDLALSIVETWLSTPFSNEDRHQRRIDKMMDCEVTPKKCKRNRVRKCRKDHTNPLVKLLTRLLCIPLVFAMTLLPIATAITNVTDPDALASALVGSGILSSFLGGQEVPETSESTVPDQSTDVEGSESEGASSGASQSETDAETGTETDTDTETDTETDTGTDLPVNDLAGGTDLDALRGSLGGLLDAGILNPEILTGELEISAEDLNTQQLMADLADSKLMEDLSSALLEDTMNAAMSSNPEEYQSTITGAKLKEIISNNSDAIVDIVHNNLSEEAKAAINTEKLKEAVSVAIEAVPTEEIDKVLENVNPAQLITGLVQSNPAIETALNVVKFVRTGALRALVLVLVLALSAVVVITRLPSLRGLASVGKSGIVAGGICYGISMVLGTPALPDVLNKAIGGMGEAAAMIAPFLSIILSMINGLAEAFETCAIVYVVLGSVTFLGTTIFRNVFIRIFDAIFSIE